MPGAFIILSFYVFVLPEISDFDQDGPLIDFTIEDGKLVVSCKGYYYIYGQAFFERHPDNRAAITVNSDPISLLQSVRQPDEATYGTRFTGTMKFLEEGDRIGFKAVYDSRFYMAPRHTFFGAYKIVGM